MTKLIMLVTALIAATCFVGQRARAADADATAAAREHFQKGLAAYADERFAEAADEFDLAYRLSPAFKLLYNIGQVDVALGRSVEAVDAFDRYLKQGAAAIPEERRREVAAEIEKQLARIGTISIRTFPDGAEIRIDGGLRGRTPLAKAVRLNAGRHTIEAALAGYAAQSREIDVVGKGDNAIEMTLEALAVPAPPPVAASPSPEPAPAPAPPAAPSPPVVERLIIETPATRAAVEKPQGDSGMPVISRAPSSSTNWQRIGGIIVMAAGLATATVGGIDAYRGINQENDAKTRLASATTDAEYDAALPDYNAGKSLNQRGWIIAGIGAAISVGGIVLVATAPEKSNTVSLASWVTTESGGVVVRGAW
jgi:tetratricopeptide (TPR) repeat protein